MTRTFTVLPAPRDARTDVDARLDALSDAPVITVFQTLAPGTRRLNGSTPAPRSRAPSGPRCASADTVSALEVPGSDPVGSAGRGSARAECQTRSCAGIVT